MTIINLTRNAVLAAQAKKALTPQERMQGLLGRESLPEGEALIITRCQSIHMFFMKFAIDVVFINKDNKVIGLCKKIQPFALSPIFFFAQAAIELPSGTIDKTKTAIGDFLQISWNVQTGH